MVLPKIPLNERPLADVAVFSVQKRKGERNKRPWIVRWAVEGRQHSRSFRTKAEADRFRTGLLVAHQNGVAFNPANGEPVSWEPAPGDVQVHMWAKSWFAEQWPDWAPRTRDSAVEGLTRFVPLAALPTAPPPPADVRRHLDLWLRPDGGDLDEGCAAWLEEWGLRLRQLDRPTLAEIDRRLALRIDGGPLAAPTARRFRQAAKSCVRRAVELGVLDADPWPPAPRGRRQTKSARSKAVAVRDLPGPSTMAALLKAMANRQPGSRMYRAMTAVAYYAGLRPSEVAMLRVRSLTLPAEGWGVIGVTEADTHFDVPGEPKTGPRQVPIPAVLVAILRSWIDEKGLSGDDLLFRTREGSRPSQSNWARALYRALEAVGHPPIRVYDCRHAAATTWLNAGVPLGEVAKRMGHSVETLISTYVGALQDDQALANQRIDAVLASKRIQD